MDSSMIPHIPVANCLNGSIQVGQPEICAFVNVYAPTKALQAEAT